MSIPQVDRFIELALAWPGEPEPLEQVVAAFDACDHVGRALDALQALKAEMDKVLADPLAIKLVTVAKTCAPRSTDLACLAKALWMEGNQYLWRQAFRRACECYEAAESIYAQLGEKIEPARMAVGKVWALGELAEFAMAERTVQRALPVLEDLDDGQRVATILLNLAIVHMEQGTLEQALNLLRQAQERFERLGNVFMAARARYTAGYVLAEMGRPHEAEEYLKAALNIMQSLGNPGGIGRVQMNLGVLFLTQGRYAEALDTLQSAVTALLAANQPTNAALAEVDIQRTCLELNRLEEVVEGAGRLEAALEGMSRVQAALQAAMACRGLGLLAAVHSHLDRVAAELRNQPAEKVVFWQARLQLEQSLLASSQGQNEIALALADQAVQTFTQAQLALYAARARLVAARAALELGNRNGAARRAGWVLRLARQRAMPHLAAPAHALLGRAAEQGRNIVQAEAHYQRAIAAIEEIRSTLPGDELRTDFLEDKLAPYADLVRLRLASDHISGAWRAIQAAKSRALIETLRNGQVSRREADAALPAEIRDLEQACRSARARLTHFTQPGQVMAALDRGDDADWRELRRLERALAEAYRRLAPHHPAAPPESLPTLSDVRRNLSVDTALIEYFVADDQVSAIIVGRSGLTAVPNFCRLSTQVRGPLLEFLHFGLADFRALSDSQLTRELSNSLADTRALLNDLYQALWSPLGEYLRPYRQVIVAPHDLLYYLPFHALYDGQDYIIDRWQVSYAPSASAWLTCRQRAQTQIDTTNLPGESNDDPALVLACPNLGHLPAATAEALAVQGAWPSARVLLDEEATSQALRTLGPQASLIHIATHAMHRHDNPSFSSLLMGGDWMCVHEIAGVDLHRTRLVVLSGCETGVSALRGGDLMGLARGFFAAGVPQLLVSQWSVRDDATARLMRFFYPRLAAGLDPAAALRSAQRSLRRLGGVYTHPYAWAPFMALGAGFPLRLLGRQHNRSLLTLPVEWP